MRPEQEKHLLLSYYGDDLTGSTDVMEALSSHGVPTVLFLRIPDEGLMARFAHCRAIGLAGTSRSETPEWMDANLPQAFAWLKSLGARVSHYKVCSTFDSSPAIGNIGRAIEIGLRVFGQRTVPLVIGAPQLRRYTAFGQLFAAYRDKIFRIDRHPVMSRHPVTPMDEADVLAHLSRQTSLPSLLIDLASLRAPDIGQRIDRAKDSGGIVLLDVSDPETQKIAGKQILRMTDGGAAFCCGSSGVEYALLYAWQEEQRNGDDAVQASVEPAGKIAVVSGSVSPTTEAQIRYACDNGFAGIALDPLRLCGDEAGRATSEAARDALGVLADGRSVVLYTALGPASDQGAELDAGARQRLGRSLGRILSQLVERAGLRRAVIAGGDTSSHALAELGVDALLMRMPLTQSPGSPLCVAHSWRPAIDGLEIAMKGGQIGLDDYFCVIRDGGVR